ncbi:MAG: MoxR family ATPase, partial [Gemmatimonadetes bacterium]|nr:MoxR family ATPase [Gemmatimonadota bacterium]
ALLEAMEERQVTVAGKTHTMPPLFMVMGTQNPIEQEGTYPLPEAQMDRFLMHVYIDYPEESSEVVIVRLVRGEEGGRLPGGSGQLPVTSGQLPVASGQSEPIREQAVFEARAEIHGIHVSEIIEQYIVQLITATRHPDRYGDELRTWIQVGASPRGSIGLDKCARVHAWLQGEDYVTPDNVRAVVHDVLRHRLILSYEANAAGVTANDVISEIVKQVAVA